MSLFEGIFGKSEWFTGHPMGIERPQITPRHADLLRRALELHPGADPHFNLQPTIDMLETADMYGFKVTRG